MSNHFDYRNGVEVDDNVYQLLPKKYAREIQTTTSFEYDERTNTAYTRTTIQDNKASRGISSYREHQDIFRNISLNEMPTNCLVMDDTAGSSSWQPSGGRHFKTREQQNYLQQSIFHSILMGIFLMGSLNVLLVLILSLIRN
tara:strand:+ start:128 stop:553 length:426 start_codon:yes stop_codon:yes gene_type:complete